VGLLAVDVTAYGVVMSADSQRVEIHGGNNRALQQRGREKRDPIVIRMGGGFVGLVGFAGTEAIESIDTAEWLRRFSSACPQDDVDAFCTRLGARLTEVWRDEKLPTVLEILVSGEVAGDVQFWYVRNSADLGLDGTHNPPADRFVVENDLDRNYIPRDALPGESKAGVLSRMTYSFRQGVLLPASPVFNGFGILMGTLYAHQVPGFALASLDDVGHYARVRMELLKRLCSSKYGIYAPNMPSMVGGDVHVYGVDRDGAIRKYVKGRHDVKTLRPGR
jgi:hypothetical protein